MTGDAAATEGDTGNPYQLTCRPTNLATTVAMADQLGRRESRAGDHGQPTVTHVFGAPGPCTVTAIAFDDNGGAYRAALDTGSAAQ